MNKKILLFILTLCLIPFVYADLGYSNSKLPVLTAPTQSGGVTNVYQNVSNVTNIYQNASQWSTYPAVSNVNLSNYNLNSVGNMSISGNFINFTAPDNEDIIFHANGMEYLYFDLDADTIDISKNMQLAGTKQFGVGETTLTDGNLLRLTGDINLVTSSPTEGGVNIQNLMFCNSNFGNCDMQNNPLVNIGDSGTDFDGGDLYLGNTLYASGNVESVNVTASGYVCIGSECRNSWPSSYNATYDAKAGTGNCPAGQVVQNTTTSGVQCVTASSGGGGGNPFDQILNTTSNVTFGGLKVNGLSNFVPTPSAGLANLTITTTKIVNNFVDIPVLKGSASLFGSYFGEIFGITGGNLYILAANDGKSSILFSDYGSNSGQITYTNSTDSLEILNIKEFKATSNNVRLTALSGTYGSGSAYVCVYNNGTLFASDSACP